MNASRSYEKRTRRRRLALLLAVCAPVVVATGCLDGEPEFSVGDCVEIEQRLVDARLNSASCEGAVGTFDPNERIYRVDSMIEDTEGGCPQLAGFFPVEFVHEPDGVTYCLVQES